MKTSIKLTIFLTFLFFVAISADVEAPTTPPTTTVTKDASPDLNSAKTSRMVIIINGPHNKNLEAYDAKNLNQAQQEVDKFIRSKVKVGDANLTEARGDGNTFVYTYQSKTNKTEQVWVVSVQTTSSLNQNKPSDSEQKTPSQKYVITSLNQVSNKEMTEEQKAQLQKQLKSQQEEMDKQFRKFDKQMKQFQQSMGDFGNQMSDLGKMFGQGPFSSWH